jgi:L-ornithine N5-monooxygenase
VKILAHISLVETSSPAEHVYDCIGIGFGPSNIALAIALEENGLIDNTLFLEARDKVAWQPGMLLEGSDIQHNPLRDLVTPRNPQSRYGFLSYLKAKGRLFEFLNLDAPFPPRTEYASYVEWVAGQFSRVVRTAQPVDAIEAIEHSRFGRVLMVSSGHERRLARTVSFGPGRSALIPEIFAPHMGPRVVHLNDYLPSIERWKAEGVKRIAVIGGSQSAAEIILDMANRVPDTQILSISRRFGFKLKDVSPFTEQIYMPDFVDYFYEAPEHEQASITRELWRSNYGAADHDVIAALNLRLYEQKVTGKDQISVLFNVAIKSLSPTGCGGFDFALADRCNGKDLSRHVDAVILATGFRNFGGAEDQEAYHPLLANLAPSMRFRGDGGVAVNRDFSLAVRDDAGAMPPVFLNGVCESTHGFGDAGSFSLLSTRSALIAGAIDTACRDAGRGQAPGGAAALAASVNAPA